MPDPSRRSLFAAAGSCAGHIAASLELAPAAAEYRVPESLGEWFMFSPRYYEVAFTAWQRELAG